MWTHCGYTLGPSQLFKSRRDSCFILCIIDNTEGQEKMKKQEFLVGVSTSNSQNTTYWECVLFHKEKGQIKTKTVDCSVLGKVMLFVEVTINQRQLSEMLVYTYPDGENTASQNFCLIYNEDFLNCTWAKGQTKKIKREGPHYLKDSGTHQHNPPDNITRLCDIGSSRNQLFVMFGDSANRCNFLKPGSTAKHTVKIRMVDTQKAHWRAWKQPIEISSKEPESILVYVYMLVILGTLVYAHRLFLPVPQAKDKLNNNDEIDYKILCKDFTHEMGNGEKEEVLTVEEVAEVPEKLNSRSLCTWDFLEVASFSFCFFLIF
ncbi:hypothetical protein FD755_024759 [Muntiacus reevesi]|uniref:Type I cytokine receptor cytokine-binding domain-containing protein n=1 Tax=Muntiacus reevesi TaxID=9886 RepID=A0A5N3UU74_MUNRE|nr:hypothetical protein FD755_024759 [Muntiacus reevesi]